jgi:hypothetical protein
LSAPFQWTELSESETLVFTGTRKPEEVPENQKYQKTRKPEQYQKYQSRFPQAQFQGVKFGFSEI